MSARRTTLILLFALATALALLLQLDAAQAGALFGITAFAALRIAQRPIDARFGGLALGAGFSFAVIAGLLAHLTGKSVLEMLATPGHWVGAVLAFAAVAFLVLGAVCLVWWRLKPGEAG